MNKQLGNAIVFAIYSVFYEAIVWGVFAYAVIYKGHSMWWFAAALFVWGCQLKPKHFGLTVKNDE